MHADCRSNLVCALGIRRCSSLSHAQNINLKQDVVHAKLYMVRDTDIFSRHAT